jgi:glycine cleavage system H protein
MKVPENLMYSKSHEWVRADGAKAYIGLTDYAQTHLGEIVFVDLPEMSSKIKAEEQLAEVESVKSVSEVYSPVSGTIIEINEELIDRPGLINEDAYGTCLAVIEMSDTAELNSLISASEYINLCGELSGEEAQ